MPADHRLVDEVVAVQATIFRAMQGSAAPDWMELGLSMAQLKTLVALEQTGPATIGHVSQALHVGLPTASHLVERLVQAGLAERAEDPQDRRRSLAVLSAEGAALVSRLRRGHETQMSEWLAQMDDADVAALLQGMRALARVLTQNSQAHEMPAATRAGATAT